MTLTFLNSFQSEWMKRTRSAAVWLTLAGGAFLPVIILLQRFYFFDTLSKDNSDPKIWEQLYGRSWQFMATFLLPMGVILATSLIGQLEYRNNTWKQLHTTPQSLTTIFFAKLLVILIMLLQFFILFNIGIYLEGLIPALLVKRVPFPAEPFPFMKYLLGNGKFLLTCLPVVALQYLLSLQYRNFLVPVGVGLGIYIFAIMAARWKYGFIIPYIYSVYSLNGQFEERIYLWSVGYFLVTTIIGYLLFIYKEERG
ncbi:ABC transporter permease [Chitinophaga sp. 22321]|uniref:ABC transporter permease n=1 Tax=Chitinophaga hostae TaxID=2831022 RepID=A0ABS5JBE0_9BACT|nr:ABC transporter permease [Chitinophaga hostae]MBS0032451.1 ABC transporter permease [Chitinophaga hostae]